jgi:hypothetical protein
MCENGTNCNHAAAHREYDRALRRAFWSQVTNRIRHHCNELIPFSQVFRLIQTTEYCTTRVDDIALDSIIGSSGRYHEYDLRFLPRRREVDDRWVNIAQAHYDGVQLPPIRLFKVGEAYYVDDGNHRVSVARVLGHESIKAAVIELDATSLITNPNCQRTGYGI